MREEGAAGALAPEPIRARLVEPWEAAPMAKKHKKKRDPGVPKKVKLPKRQEPGDYTEPTYPWHQVPARY